MAGNSTAAEAAQHSPTLARLLKSRLAPIREKALFKAALDDEKPTKPPAGECCGSSCNPCIMDLYREELKVWKECAEYRACLGYTETAATSESSSATTTPGDGKHANRMPGSLDW